VKKTRGAIGRVFPDGALSWEKVVVTGEMGCWGDPPKKKKKKKKKKRKFRWTKKKPRMGRGQRRKRLGFVFYGVEVGILVKSKSVAQQENAVGNGGQPGKWVNFG